MSLPTPNASQAAAMPTQAFALAAVLAALALTAGPATAQNFYHAPPGDDAPLLPFVGLEDVFRSPSRAKAKRTRPARPSTPHSRSAAPAAAIAPSQIAPVPPVVPGVPAAFVPPTDVKPIPTAAARGDRWEPVDRPAAQRPPAPPAPQAAVKPLPATSDAARSLAAERLAAGEPAEAESILVEAVGRFPGDADLAVALARLRESREDWPGAVAAYDAVLKLRPEDSRWRLRRAECLYHAKDFESAAAEYEAVAADPEALSVGEYARFGDAALRAGDPAAAESAFEALSKIAEEPIPQVELLRGLAALKQGQTDRARLILLKANARWPQDPALTDALRLTAAMHYGDGAAMVATAERKSAPAHEGSSRPTRRGAIVTTSAEFTTEVLPGSGWRRATGGSIGWRPTSVNLADGREPGEPAYLP